MPTTRWGRVTITGLADDLSTFNGGTYTASTGTWTGTAAQFNALTFTAGETSATLSITATNTTTGGDRSDGGELHADRQPGGGRSDAGGGATSATVSEGGLVTLGVTEAKFDSDDTLGTVTITGLPGDLSNFSGGTLHREHRDLDRHGGAVHCADVHGRGDHLGDAVDLGDQQQTGGDRSDGGELHADRQPGGGRSDAGRCDLGDGERGRSGHAGRDGSEVRRDDTLGTVTITGLAGDLSNFSGGTLHREHRDLDRDGGAVQCADVHGRGDRRRR